MENEFLSNTISTLIINGFNIGKVTRFPNKNNLIYAHKFDKLGAKISYGILFSPDTTETPIVRTLISQSRTENFNPILVSDHLNVEDCQTYTNPQFFDFFGGIINTGLILVPNLSSILNDLGSNKLPPGLSGEPDDLHELYITECLQFLTDSPTRRYGIERSFQSLPDGVIIGKQKFMILLDSKSYSKGFSFKADDIKRFASYVDDFNNRYSSYFGNIFSFLVVSGDFTDSIESLQGRSNELYKLCNCKLSCIRSEDLGGITQRLISLPDFKKSIVWKNIFSETFINEKTITEEITRIKKDRLH